MDRPIRDGAQPRASAELGLGGITIRGRHFAPGELVQIRGGGPRLPPGSSLRDLEEGVRGTRLAPTQRSCEGPRLSGRARKVARHRILAPTPAEACAGEKASRPDHGQNGAAAGCLDSPTRHRSHLVVDGHWLGRHEAREAVERVRRALPLPRLRRARWCAREVLRQRAARADCVPGVFRSCVASRGPGSVDRLERRAAPPESEVRGEQHALLDLALGRDPEPGLEGAVACGEKAGERLARALCVSTPAAGDVRAHRAVWGERATEPQTGS